MDVMDMFMALIVVMVSQAYTYPQMHQVVYFKYVQFFVCLETEKKAVSFKDWILNNADKV